MVWSLAARRSHADINNLLAKADEDAKFKFTQQSLGDEEWPAPPPEMHLKKRFDYSSAPPRVPARDDAYFNAMAQICEDKLEYAYGWLIRFHWFKMYCDGDTVVVICQQRNGRRTSMARHHCPAHEKCIERQGFLNPLGVVVSTAACVPNVWRWLVKQASNARERLGGLCCGYATAIYPESYLLASSMMDLTVHISRLRTSERAEVVDIKADDIFFWDNTDPKRPVLLESVSDTAKSSVPVLLEKGKKKEFEVCVVVPDYWRRREGEVVIDFMHSYQYHMVGVKKLGQ